MPELYGYLETRHIGYATGFLQNEVLQREIAHLLVRPSRKAIVSYCDFAYQAESWALPDGWEPK